MANHDLVEYIGKQRANRVSDDVIKSSLLKAGWQALDIEEAFEQGNQFPQEMKKRAKTVPILAVCILFLTIATAAYGAYRIFPKKSQTIDGSKSSPGAATAVQEISSDWKTHKNEELQLSFKYPSNWEIEDLGDSQIRLREIGKKGEIITLEHVNNEKYESPAAFDLVINVSPEESGKSLEEVVSKIADSTIEDPTFLAIYGVKPTGKTEKITVNGVEAYSNVISVNGTEYGKFVYIKNGGKMYNFYNLNATLKSDDPYVKNGVIFDQIVSSIVLLSS